VFGRRLLEFIAREAYRGGSNRRALGCGGFARGLNGRRTNRLLKQWLGAEALLGPGQALLGWHTIGIEGQYLMQAAAHLGRVVAHTREPQPALFAVHVGSDYARK
jgi:hypothetical protein